MSESTQIILGLIFLIGVYVLTRYAMIWRIRRTSRAIIKDLERRGALDPASSAELPYAKTHFFRIGLRDYRPKALEYLVQGGIVAKTENGRYYLLKRLWDLEEIFQG